MKKNYKLAELAKGEINFTDSNIISCLDIVKIYLQAYNQFLRLLDDNSEIQNITDEKGNNFDVVLEKKDHLINANIFDKNNNEIINFSYEFNKLLDLKLKTLYYNKNVYDENKINNIILLIKQYIQNFAKLNIQFSQQFDRSHNSLYSVNSKASLYLVDDEAIVFPSDLSYFSLTIDDEDQIHIDGKNMEVLNELGLAGCEEKILNNIYFNISDAPSFLRDDLINVRNAQLESKSNVVDTEKQLKRTRNWFKK